MSLVCVSEGLKGMFTIASFYSQIVNVLKVML